MKRIALAAGLAACFGLLAASARGDDTVVRRDKSGKDVIVTGTIVEESPAGVKIKPAKDTQLIPPDDIVDVGYAVPNVSDIEFRTPHAKEQDALGQMGEERKKGLEEALTLYAALLKRVKGTANAERFIQYRIAMVAVEQAKDDPTKTPAAIAALNGYRTSNSGGWEIVPATKTAARLMQDGGDRAGAVAAYNDLADPTKTPGVPPDVQLAMNLLVAKMLLADKQYKEAGDKLKTALDGTTDEKQRGLLQVYLAQTQLAQGNLKDVETQVRDVIKTAADDGLKAAAFNTLGDYYQQAQNPKEAFWQYLRVDVLYSQDREEHARALYNLWKLFDSDRGDAQRSKECLDRLKDKGLDGTEYQARAIKEAPSDK